MQLGGDFRRGALDVDGHEVVGGIVVMRTGENAREVIARVKEKIAQIPPGLPPGVSIRPFYDRSELIDRTIDTLKHALIEEIILVTLAHIVFLFHFRSILIVTLPLPVSILISFILMNAFGITSNIMSLAGIAIAIGVLVDAGIVMTENVIRHCEEAEATKGGRLNASETVAGDARRGAAGRAADLFRHGDHHPGVRPGLRADGPGGKLFHPLAFTKTFAMIGSTLLAVTLVPVLCSLLVRGPFHSEEKLVMKRLLRLYDPALDWALRHRKSVLRRCALARCLPLVAAFGWQLVAARLAQDGKRIHADAERRQPAVHAGSCAGTSLTEVKRIMAWQDRVIESSTRSPPRRESSAGPKPPPTRRRSK